MKGNVRKLGILMIILVVFGTEAKAQIAKEGVLSETWTYSGSFKALPMGAETMNYKFYTYVAKGENYPAGDVEGHILSLYVRRSFYVFETGEIATASAVGSNDLIKGAGSLPSAVLIPAMTDIGTCSGRY